MTGKPYDVTFRVPMSDKAHALLDQIIVLDTKDRHAVEIALRAMTANEQISASSRWSVHDREEPT